MSIDHLSMDLRAGESIRLSSNAALYLSQKVSEVQRDIVHQLRTEAADQARPETAEKEADGRRAEGRNDDKEDFSDVPDGDTSGNTAEDTVAVNITV